VPATAAAQSTPAPAAPKLSITTEQVTVAGGPRVRLTGQQWRVRVVLQPLVAGQTAVLRFYRGGRRLQAAQLPLAPSPTGQSAFATFSRQVGQPGDPHPRDALRDAAARDAEGEGGRRLDRPPSARPGARGRWSARFRPARAARLRRRPARASTTRGPRAPCSRSAR
jgi:hypothetical protein